ncbi:MAG: hypothetical protein IH602_23240 [Bryobacteraceae bacterium]|nr:hypothetical protein [Bryobacteraceae bacterium]
MTRLINKAYYAVRPYVPWRVRIGVRRWLAERLRRENSGVWPIDERAGVKPPGWPGWPEGKQFAFVLTHDVEAKVGLAKVERLMELDRSYGFRAAFNFVPEGNYRVADELRARLEAAGFEVGVHGLKHDGRLFVSKAHFAMEAEQIREYVKKWAARGFRSPLMHHNLAWMHMIGTEYDASTFDTDPFEPESDGVGTIFPFWVAAPDGGGYVELPYTLAQDFTLFTILQERSIDVWKRKLDWIAECGGMALLNTHPDYMCFDGQPAQGEASVKMYEEFLRYARERYGGVFWEALPCEVARYYRAEVAEGARNSRRKICMVAGGGSEEREARQCAGLLTRRGDWVDLITIGEACGHEDDGNGVRVHRIEQGGGAVGRRVRAAAMLMRRHYWIRYDLVQVFGNRGQFDLATMYPKWTGIRVLADWAKTAGPGARDNEYLQLVDSLMTDRFSENGNGAWRERS